MDTFYVTDLLGHKIFSKDRLAKVESALLAAIAAGEPQGIAAEEGSGLEEGAGTREGRSHAKHFV